MKIVNQMYIHPRHEKNHLSLDGQWSFAWEDRLFDLPDAVEYKHNAEIPGSVFWNLYEAGVLPHPYEACNSKQYAWVDSKVWYFTRRFKADASLDLGRAILCFDGAAYYTRLWLNDTLLGDHNGMFGGPVVEVHNLINYGGENEITVAICAANHPDMPPYDIRNADNQAIVPWNVVRDANSSNGDFIVLGLWRSVRIEFLPPMHLARPYLMTESIADGSAKLRLEVELIQPEYDEFAYPREYDSDTYQYTFAYQSGMANAFQDETVRLAVEIREKTSGMTALREVHDVPLLDYAGIGVSSGFDEPNFISLSLTLPDAILWNPVGLGDPFLYEILLTLEHDGVKLDALQFDAGIRMIEFLPTAGKKMRSKWDNFLMQVNGQRFFLKGVNWMPVDFLYREDEKEYRWILGAVKSAGIQLIRVWSGGGYPESEHFYNICNELGILVWQDSFIANMHTPCYCQDELQEQICLYIYRLRNHPSLAVHCGGNEFNPYSFGNAASMYIIERNLHDLDPFRHFKRTTPDKGSAHIYRDMEPVWYRHSYGQLPFVGESGIHSFPNAKSLQQLMNAAEYTRPVSNMVENSFRDTHPELLNHFTEYVPERVPRMLSRASTIADVATADIETLAIATQMASAEFYQIMIQSMRENYPTCGGIMLWVLKRSWTTVGIQLIDGLGEPIVPYYYVKNAYSEINCVVALPHLIYAPGEQVVLLLRVINESGQRLDDALIKLEVFNDRLKLMKQWHHNVNIPKDLFITEIAQHTFDLPEHYSERFFFIRMSIYKDGRMRHQSVYWPKSLARMLDEAYRAQYRGSAQENIVFSKGPWLKDSICAADKAELACSGEFVSCNGDFNRYRLRIVNKSDIAAFPVSIQVAEDGCVQNPSDNYFFLPCRESRELIVDYFDGKGGNRELTLHISAWNVLPQMIKLNG